jgi:DNA anti-recombination protein RmuC
MIQETRDEFRAAVDESLAESEERRQALNDTIANAGDESATLLGEFVAHATETQTNSNQDRADSFQADSQAKLDEFLANVQEQRDLINEWFADRLEWIEKLTDDYYRK